MAAHSSVGSSEYVSLFRPEMERFVMKCNQTAVFLEPMIYVFGGSDGITAFNTLSAFNLDTRVWSEIPIEKLSSSYPCARTKHAACLVRWNHKDYIYIYGGIDGVRYLSDFWRCDLSTGVFEEIHGVSQRTPPPALSSHCLARLGSSELVLFGGVSNKQLVTQTWYYSLDSNTWSTNAYRDCDQPEPCMGATLTTMVGNHCLLFGGISSNGFLSHCWKLYPNHKWELLPVQKNGPMSRAFHCAVPVGEGRLLIHGGEYGKQCDQKLADTWVLYESNRIWKRIIETEFTPQPRSNHATVIWQSRSGSYRLFIMGGRGREGMAAEFWCLNLSKAGLGREDYLQLLTETQLKDGMHNYVVASGTYDINGDSSMSGALKSSRLGSHRGSVSFNMPDQPLEPEDIANSRSWTPTKNTVKRASSRSYSQMEDETRRRHADNELAMLSNQLTEAVQKVNMLTEAHNMLSENMTHRLGTIDRAVLELRSGATGVPVQLVQSMGGSSSAAVAAAGPGTQLAHQLPEVASLRTHMETEFATLRSELADGLARAASIASTVVPTQRQQTFHPEILKSEIIGECRKLLQNEVTKAQSEILTSTRLQCNGVQESLKLDIDNVFESVKGINATVQRVEAAGGKYVLKTDVQSHELRLINLEAASTNSQKTLAETRQAVSSINELLSQINSQIVQFCEGKDGRKYTMQDAVKNIVSYDISEVQAKCSRMESLLTALDSRTKELSELTDKSMSRQDIIEKKLSEESGGDVLKRDDTSALFIQNTSTLVIMNFVGDLRSELTAVIASLRDDLSKVAAVAADTATKGRPDEISKDVREAIVGECMIATQDLVEATANSLVQASVEEIRRMISSTEVDVEGLRKASVSSEKAIEEIKEAIAKLQTSVPACAGTQQATVEAAQRDFGKSLTNASDVEVLFDKCYGYIDIVRDDIKNDSAVDKAQINKTLDEYSERLITCEAKIAEFMASIETAKCAAAIVNTGADGVLSATSSFCSTPGGGDSKTEETLKKLKGVVSRLTKEATSTAISIKSLIENQQKLGDDILKLRQDTVGGSTKALISEMNSRIELMRAEIEKKASTIASLEARIALLEQTKGYTYDEIVAIFHNLMQYSSPNKVASNSMVNMDSVHESCRASAGSSGEERPINVSQSLLTTEHLKLKSEMRRTTNTVRRSSVQCAHAAVTASSLQELIEVIPASTNFNARAWRGLMCVQRSIYDKATISNMFYDQISVDPAFNFVVASDGAFLRVWKINPLTPDEFNTASTIKGSFDIIAAEDVIECPGVTCSTMGGNLLCAGNDKGYLAAWPSVGDPYQLIAYPNSAASCISVLTDKEKRYIISGGESGGVLSWNPLEGNSAALGTHTAKVTCADTTGIHALTGSRDCSAIFWDIAEGRECTRCLGHPDSILSCHICKEQSELCVTGSADGTVRLWDMRLNNAEQDKAKSRCLFMASNANTPVKDIVSVFVNRDLMVSTCIDGSIKLWDIRASTPECIQTLTIDSGRVLCSAVLNNTMIISADAGSLLALEFSQ